MTAQAKPKPVRKVLPFTGADAARFLISGLALITAGVVLRSRWFMGSLSFAGDPMDDPLDAIAHVSIDDEKRTGIVADSMRRRGATASKQVGRIIVLVLASLSLFGAGMLLRWFR